ncbi:MAG: hypothetical protein Q4B70_01635 [Lachnospiraceae bacterium]|nr:hypothetical protein [Lachnospiraceae bacterium]
MDNRLYMIMHGERKVAVIYKNGDCKIYQPKMMPYNLYLEENAGENLDLRLQNLDNFYYWCASRVLPLDRQYAKEILNSIGASQAVTDRDRAKIALSYHCLSLMDVFWTREPYERQSFSNLNLYRNHLKKAFVDVVLRGCQMTVQNSRLMADDLSTPGCFPKAWVRKEGEFWLLKGGDEENVKNELLASRICQCFQVNQVRYQEDRYDGEIVAACKMITSPEQSIVPMEHFEIYALNHDIDKMEYILKLDGYSYYMMNILDYLIGNTDRHWGNWGVLVDNSTNLPIRLYDLMDFNKAFSAYDTLNGANCLTTIVPMSQRQAALEAVKEIGWNQKEEIQPEWFENPDRRDMFFKRLASIRN